MKKWIVVLFLFLLPLFSWSGGVMMMGGGVGGGVVSVQLVQHADFNQFYNGNDTTSLVVRLPNPVLSGNCIIVSIFNTTPQTVSGVTDDQSNTYSLAKSQTHSGGQVTSVFVALNATAGARKITITFSAATTYIAVKVSEFCGIAAASAVDQVNGNYTTSTTITAGSITPTISGDLLYQVGFQDTVGAPQATAIFTVGSQSNITWKFAPGSTQSQDGSYVQYGQYDSVSAINPTLTVDDADGYVNVIISLKSASAGTPPGSGIRVVAAQHVYLWSYGSPIIQWITTGNLQLILSTSGDGIASVTSSNGNTWQSRVSAEDSHDASFGQVLDSLNATSGTQQLTVNFAATTEGYHDIILLDVIGAATSPVDTTAKLENQRQTSDTGTLTTVSITPTTSNGLVVVAVPISMFTLSDLTGSGHLSLVGTPTPIQADFLLDENNGYGIFYNPNTNAVQFIFTILGSGGAGVDYWSAGAVAYKAP